jgi:hypothetical protein
MVNAPSKLLLLIKGLCARGVAVSTPPVRLLMIGGVPANSSRESAYFAPGWPLPPGPAVEQAGNPVF